jgi:hypothetical protein
VITICDREGDRYELFAKAEELDEAFLIRIVWMRYGRNGVRAG